MQGMSVNHKCRVHKVFSNGVEPMQIKCIGDGGMLIARFTDRKSVV